MHRLLHHVVWTMPDLQHCHGPGTEWHPVLLGLVPPPVPAHPHAQAAGQGEV